LVVQFNASSGQSQSVMLSVPDALFKKNFLLGGFGS
jgi:hypothetical protein